MGAPLGEKRPLTRRRLRSQEPRAGMGGEMTVGSITSDPDPVCGRVRRPWERVPYPAASPYLCMKLHLAPYLQLPLAKAMQG